MNYIIEFGDLICPNCQNNKMNKYSFWSSRKINEYTKQWLFYNKIEKKRRWKCWSIFELCGKTTKIWYDPCGLCFNPCAMDKETIGKSKAKELLCLVIIKCLILYFLYGFIYIGYVFLFLWFDIFCFLCYKETLYEILMDNGQDKIIPIKDGLWKNFEITGYNDYFWEDNFPNLFKCERCYYVKNTFNEFAKKGENMVVNNNHDTGTQLVNISDSHTLPN